MPDRFFNKDTGLSDPATRHFAISPGTGFDQPTRGIYVGGDGNIVIEDMHGTAVTYNGAKAGSIIPIRATKVVSATATGLVGMY